MLEKLSALIRAPHAHLVRYAGILAPAAKWRALIVPTAGAPVEAEPAIHRCEFETTTDSNKYSVGKRDSEAGTREPSVARHGRNYTWAELMKRVWAVDVLECPQYQGRMRILAAIHSPDTIGKILECLGLHSRAPPVAPAVPEFNVPIEPF